MTSNVAAAPPRSTSVADKRLSRAHANRAQLIADVSAPAAIAASSQPQQPYIRPDLDADRRRRDALKRSRAAVSRQQLLDEINAPAQSSSPSPERFERSNPNVPHARIATSRSSTVDNRDYVRRCIATYANPHGLELDEFWNNAARFLNCIADELTDSVPSNAFTPFEIFIKGFILSWVDSGFLPLHDDCENAIPLEFSWHFYDRRICGDGFSAVHHSMGISFLSNCGILDWDNVQNMYVGDERFSTVPLTKNENYSRLEAVFCQLRDSLLPPQATLGHTSNRTKNSRSMASGALGRR
jgi:hypothetical protein